MYTLIKFYPFLFPYFFFIRKIVFLFFTYCAYPFNSLASFPNA
jgi:hypothetical protein